jgi:hypothetical protein
VDFLKVFREFDSHRNDENNEEITRLPHPPTPSPRIGKGWRDHRSFSRMVSPLSGPDLSGERGVEVSYFRNGISLSVRKIFPARADFVRAGFLLYSALG